MVESTDPSSSEAIVRRRVLAVLAFGMAGVAAELLLLGHTETKIQWLPLGMLAVGLLAVAALLIWPRKETVQSATSVMAIFVMTGFLGLYQHYNGNKEFELEMYPSMEGLELFRETMTGATPALAPGTMVLLGLVGLATCYGYPLSSKGDAS